MKQKGILYLIADRSLGDEKILEALAAGADMIQLREKNVTSARYLEDAKWLREQTKRTKTLFLVNDRLDIALASGADGVHLGKDDMPVAEARRIAAQCRASGFLIGATAKTAEQAAFAEKSGADYLGSGAWFSTATKPEASMISEETYREILSASSLPNVAIGGLTPENCLLPLRLGACGIAVSGGVFQADSVSRAVKEFQRILKL